MALKTPIYRLVEHLRTEYPDLQISPHLIFNFKQLEQMEQQLAYNSGFANAKKMYLSEDTQKLKPVEEASNE
jgi:hypothetical protein